MTSSRKIRANFTEIRLLLAVAIIATLSSGIISSGTPADPAPEGGIEVTAKSLTLGSGDVPEYKDFDPLKLQDKLRQKASESQTSTEKYNEELKELVTYHQKNLTWKFRYERFEKKYDVIPKPNVLTPETITYRRLALMFPHLNDFTVAVKFNNSRAHPIYQQLVPNIMRYPEFGGLIPRDNSTEIPENVRKSIVELHLMAITCLGGDLGKEAPILEQRIEKSLLSDKQRVALLKEGGVLSGNKDINDILSRLREERKTVICSPFDSPK